VLRNYLRTGGTVWEQWRYRFNFGSGVYAMDGKKLRIRPAEELYLYERLMLYKPPKATTCRYAIQQLRKRYGTDFLAEVFVCSASTGVEGHMRKGLFDRILQEYLEKNGEMTYEKWGYRFDFLNGSYTWNGEELRVTQREAVFLYERTVLRLQGRRGVRRYTVGSTLYDMRKKFGRRFLHELFPNEETAKDAATVIRQRGAKAQAPSAASTDGQKSDILE
jgi:hypothetical protein